DNGANSWTVSNIPNGVNANIEVTNDNNCKSTVEIEAPDCGCLEFEFSWTNITCEGENDGTITIDFVTPGATVLLNGQPFVEGQLYPPGEYTIEAFFNNNEPDCYFSETFEILEPPAVTVQASGTDETCYDANDGTITVFGLSENACYVILKNGTGPDLSNQDFFEPGIYFIIATVCDDFINDTRVIDPCEALAVVNIKAAKGNPCDILTGYITYPDCDTPELNYLTISLQQNVNNPQCNWELDATAIANGWSLISPPDSPVMYFEPGEGKATFTATLSNDGACDQVCKIYAKSPCETGPKKGMESFTLYPNPVKDVLTVDFKKELTEDTRIEIYDLLGNTVYTNRLNKTEKSNVNIDFSNFPGNVYYMKVTDKNGTTIKKVLLDK
ncbi:MAG: T9SS type A sorting domain-containing protein, partial [Flavobacteriaceae bacterium]|nr:T9SS type A sorting domain-containing protein [Flavobacteriaceae bacterium]